MPNRGWAHKGVANMVDGFWIVQYEGMKGNGGGVVMLIKGQVFGGDTGYIYTGTYTTSGDDLKAHVIVQNFLPDVHNIMGVVGDLELDVSGKISGDVIKGTGSVSGGGAVGIAVKFTRRGNLPT
jgi:hypothetical protein